MVGYITTPDFKISFITIVIKSHNKNIIKTEKLISGVELRTHI